jgi:iron complex transport system substrate-binding protein
MEELMNRYLKLCLSLFLSLAFFLIAGCTQQSTEPKDTKIEVIDQLGRVVTLEKAPQRIISLSPANTEILYALGLGDRVVARTDYCNYPLEVTDKPSVGGFSDPNLEKIVSFTPDLVLASNIHEKLIIPQLEEKGIKVLALDPKTIDEVLAALDLVGRVTEEQNKSSELVKSLQKRIKAVTDVTDKLTTEERLKVLYLVWHDPLYVAGSNTFHDELIKKAGGVNIVADEGYPSISLETIITSNPDVILAGVGMGEGMDAPLIFAQQEARLRDVAARENGCIYGVNSDIVDRAGPRIVDALEKFALSIHPELFK